MLKNKVMLPQQHPQKHELTAEVGAIDASERGSEALQLAEIV